MGLWGTSLVLLFESSQRQLVLWFLWSIATWPGDPRFNWYFYLQEGEVHMEVGSVGWGRLGSCRLVVCSVVLFLYYVDLLLKSGIAFFFFFPSLLLSLSFVNLICCNKMFWMAKYKSSSSISAYAGQAGENVVLGWHMLYITLNSYKYSYGFIPAKK